MPSIISARFLLNLVESPPRVNRLFILVTLQKHYLPSDTVVYDVNVSVCHSTYEVDVFDYDTIYQPISGIPDKDSDPSSIYVSFSTNHS